MENNMITNYSGNFVDSESRQAIEIMSNTIQSLFYGKDFRNEIVKQAKEVIYPQIKQEIVSSSLETEQRILGKIKENVECIVDDKFQNREVTSAESEKISQARNKKVREYLGHYDDLNDEYTLYSRFFFGKIAKEVKTKFNISTYKQITSGQVEEVIGFINALHFDKKSLMAWAKQKLDNSYYSGEWDDLSRKSAKLKAAYKRLYLAYKH